MCMRFAKCGVKRSRENNFYQKKNSNNQQPVQHVAYNDYNILLRLMLLISILLI